MTELTKQVGDAIRERRQNQGLTQAGLAEATGRSTDMVSRLERGEVAPSFETLELIAKALNAQPGDFFPHSGAPDRPSVQKVVRRVEGLSEHELAWIDEMLGLLARKPEPQTY
jgi:transcriptional regulator with XRE-family HTH domain